MKLITAMSPEAMELLRIDDNVHGTASAYRMAVLFPEKTKIGVFHRSLHDNL